MTDKRPRDMTTEELDALPVGPFIRCQRPVTAVDRAKGIHGRVIEWEEVRLVRCGHVEGSDIMLWRDASGQAWTFGQWADGEWFKQASFL